MSRAGSKWSSLAVAVSCLVGLGLLFAPPRVTEPVRLAVRDALHPGQVAVHQLARWTDRAAGALREADAQAREIARLRSEVKHWQLQSRRLRLASGRAHDDGPEPKTDDVYQAAPSEPLLVPELIEARVLGDEVAAAWRAGAFIDVGQTDGLREDEFVLEDVRPMIDQGNDVEIGTGQPVYAGRSVVGRIARVGRWTSTVTPITDPEFRGLARLARASTLGTVFGAEGILEGTGDGACRLRFIPSTEPVTVGDEVVTGGRDGLLPEPMFYGVVVEATLAPGAPHWDIRVEPAADLKQMRKVHVLRKSFNPVRLKRPETMASGEGNPEREARNAEREKLRSAERSSQLSTGRRRLRGAVSSAGMFRRWRCDSLPIIGPGRWS